MFKLTELGLPFSVPQFWFGLGVAPRCTGAVWAQGRLPSSEKGAGKMVARIENL